MSKNILITGANRGIGLAIARHLNTQGHHLSLGVRSPEKIPADLKHCHHGFFDARNPQSALDWVDAASTHLQPIDAVIHCAGIFRSFTLDDDEAILDELFDVNVKGTLRLAKATMPKLIATGSGRFIHLVSMSGKRIKSKQLGYGMSKYAQLALGHGLRNIGWDDGVRVTAICPSWVNTDMAINNNRQMEPHAMTQPEDIAKIVASILELPNQAVVNEVLINCNLEY